MYLRPRSMFSRFVVEEKVTRINDMGRQVIEYVPTGEEILGVLSTIETFEREKFKHLSHEVKWGIVQRLGRPKAKVGDKLICGDKVYIVETVDNPANLSQWYVYWCSERFDLKG